MIIANSLRPGTLVKLNPTSVFARNDYRIPAPQLPVNTIARVIRQSPSVNVKVWYEVQWVQNGETNNKSYPIDHLLIIDFKEYIKLL